MNKQLRFIVFFLFVITLGMIPCRAQTAFASEDELKQQAAKLFDDDSFEEAYPLYSQLVSLYPKDPNYNYRLGVCMLYASDDKEKPIPFLEYAAKSPGVDKEVIFYLARAYHLNYRFDDAITKYMEYEKVASSSKAQKLQVERQIEMCRNGKKLLRNITDLVVIDKKELSRADFYRAYDISDIGGKLLAKPDEDAFKSPIDKKKKEKSIIYLASNNNQVYFSSYGDDPSHGKDIYIIRKLPNGEWSKPQTLGYPVNTEYDEDYPFLHPNGKVLYFCSKGHNSMGGYDIFKTTLNEETNTWNKPVNLDFPINTPDDDILYVTNEDEKEAFFSSARNSKTGKTAVFHINVERKPIDVAIIKGAVMRNREGQALDVKITVKDLADNMILGIYNSKAETGGYLINLPNGGKFMYTVEAAGFATQSEVVILPTQYEFKPLKQEISYELGTDKLIVKNMFDEPVDDQSYLQVLSFIKEKARMDAGISNENAIASVKKGNTADDIATPAAVTDNTPQVSDYGTRVVEHQGVSGDGSTGTAAGNKEGSKAPPAGNKTGAPAALSNSDIVKIAYDDAKDAGKEAKDLQEQADIALNLANEKNELAQNKTQEATQLMNDANSMTDNAKKQTAIEEAGQARAEQDELNQETVAAFNIAKKLALKAAAKAEEADLSMQYAKDLEAAVKSKNATEAMAKLEEQEKKLEALSEQNGSAEPDNITTGLKMDADAKKRELDKAVQASADIKQEMQDNITLIGSLRSDLEKTKKQDLKQGINDQIAGLEADNDQSRKDLEQNELQVAKLQKEYNGIKNEMELVSSVVDKSRTGTGEEAAASVKSIDKAKLEQQVNEIRTSVENVPPAVAAATSAAGTAKENTPVTTDAAAADDAAAYDQQFSGELAAAANIPDALDRENKKAQIYQSWTGTLSNALEQKKQELKNEKDKDKKKILNDAIASLEKELKEKQQEQDAVVAGVQKLQQASATADSAAGQPGGDASGPAHTVAEDGSVLSIGHLNDTYAPQLADADKITDNVEREKAKAEVLKNWSDAISSVIIKEKEEMAAATDPAVKEELAKNISEAQQLSDEKQTQASASLAQAEALKKQQDVASDAAAKQGDSVPGNTSPVAAKEPDAAGKLDEAIAEAEKAGTELSRENKKKEAYAVYIAAENDDLKTKQAALKTEKDKNTKKELTQEIAGIQADIKEKQQLMDASAAQAKALEEQQAVAADNTDVSAGTDEGSSSAAKPVQAAISYSSPVAAGNLRQAAALQEESDELDAKAETLKTQAKAAGSPSGREALNQQAATLEQQAGAKKTEAAQLTSEANIAEYRAGGDVADQLAAASVNNSSDEVAMAGMLKDEAKMYFDRAEKSRALAATVTSEEDRSAALEDALKNQETALEKQQKSIDLYKKNNPGFVLKPAAANTAGVAASGTPQADRMPPAAPDALSLDHVNDTYAPQLADANRIADNVEREKVKADVLKNWSDAINTVIAKQKQEIAAATDPSRKADLAEQIVKAQQLSEEKQMQASASKEQAAALEQQALAPNTLPAADHTPVAAGNDVTGDKEQPAGQNGGSQDHTLKSTSAAGNEDAPANGSGQALKPVSSDAGNTPAAAAPDALSLDHVNDTYAPQLADANRIADNVEREKAKADVLKNWSDAINTVIAKQKQEMAAATDPSRKADLAEQIVKAQQLSEEKQMQASASKEQAAALASNAAQTNGGAATAGNEGTADAVPADNGASATDHTLKSGTAPAPGNEQAASAVHDKPEGSNAPADDGTASGDTHTTAERAADVTASPVDTGTQPAVLAADEKFERTSVPAYSASKPIPVNEKLPEGLVFKVQIGAFRNPIAPDMFSGMKPITAETTSQGFTRYTAGLFTKFATADKVKSEIRGLGYKDAFVVAFLNGKRISIAEALRMSGETAAIPAAGAAPAGTNGQPAIAAVDNAGASGTTPADAGTVPAGNVAAVGGLFYTVQVGVYSHPVSPEILHNVRPLYTERTASGALRYNTGMYNSVQYANEARSVVVRMGIKDAFVTAYYQGKRISMAEAATLETQGSSVFSTGEEVNRMPDGQAAGAAVQPGATGEHAVPAVKSGDGQQTKSDIHEITGAPAAPAGDDRQPAGSEALKSTVAQNNTMPADPGVVFKVQIGAFKDEVPLEIANQFLKIAGKGIKNYKDENGLTIYTLGNFKTYEEAAQLRKEITEVVKDAFIVAYNDGKKISIDEAKSLLNK